MANKREFYLVERGGPRLSLQDIMGLMADRLRVAMPPVRKPSPTNRIGNLVEKVIPGTPHSPSPQVQRTSSPSVLTSTPPPPLASAHSDSLIQRTPQTSPQSRESSPSVSTPPPPLAITSGRSPMQPPLTENMQSASNSNSVDPEPLPES